MKEQGVSFRKQSKVLWAIFIAFFLVFLILSIWSPVAGDDWAYAVNSIGQHPILMAFERYFTWSGRFFSELWGYIVPRNKWLWDWLNPCIFTGILWMLLKNTQAKKHIILSTCFAIVCMFTVTQYVRSQTYTWMMGTTYVIPLLLFLILLYEYKDVFLEGEQEKKKWICLGVLNFVIPLWMENAAAIVVGADLLILLYLWFHDRKSMKQMWILTAIGVVATLIIKFSPGAAGRLALDHPDWLTMSFFAKIQSNWQAFLRFTFTDNTALIRCVSIVMILFVISKWKDASHAKWMNVLLIACFALGIIQSYSYNIYEWTGISLFYQLSDVTWMYFNRINTVIYGLWTLAILFAIFKYLKGNQKWFTALVFFCAGGANLVMLYSPIFDARSSLYTIYLFILVGLLFLEEIEFPKQACIALSVACGVLITMRTVSYLQMYQNVAKITDARNAYLSWYLGDRSVTDGVMPAYPETVIHSGNIDPQDEFHLYYFLRYYDLDPNLKLTFEDVDLSTVGN